MSTRRARTKRKRKKKATATPVRIETGCKNRGCPAFPRYGGSVMSRSLLASLSFGLVATAALLSRSSSEPSGEPTESALRAVGALHPRLAPAGDRVAFSYQGAIWLIPATG